MDFIEGLFLYLFFFFFFFFASLNSLLSLSFIHSAFFLSRSSLDWCVQVFLLSMLYQMQSSCGHLIQQFSYFCKVFSLAWILVSSRNLTCLWASDVPALETCILYSITLPTWLRNIPCKHILLFLQILLIALRSQISSTDGCGIFSMSHYY